MSVRISSVTEYNQLLDSYDTWLFDCDGVLWRGDELLDGTAEVLDILRRRSKKVVFVTNNASKSRKSYKKKFDQLGIDVHVDEIYGSAYAAAVYLSSVINLPKTKKVYVIGTAGLEEELRDEGISVIGGTDPKDNTLDAFDLSAFTMDPEVGAVVCGGDTQINYTKLSKAFQYLTHIPGCHFVTTNEDSTFPTAAGLLPGAGSISASLRYALNRNSTCTGKPSGTMLDCIKAKFVSSNLPYGKKVKIQRSTSVALDRVDFNPQRTIMVGDRLNTDILFGQNGGLATLLVLTGITTEAELTGPNASPIVPNFVTQTLGDFRIVESPPP